MKQWYVKDLSNITNVSVQTLHHYDRIGLLKPSVRLSNGYRVYSENDLLKLQQIIALKFFGFSLAQIRRLLNGEMDLAHQLSIQSDFLEEKAVLMLDASKTLKRILSDCDFSKSMPWKTMIELIEVFQMTQQAEKNWAERVFTDEELKEYKRFEEGLADRFSPTEKAQFEQAWEKLVKDIEGNLQENPASEFGIRLGRQCMEMVTKVYGENHIELRNTVWEKGFKSGESKARHGLSKAGVEWLDKAIEAYYGSRIQGILSQINKADEQQLIQEWKQLMFDMCGRNKEDQLQAIDICLSYEGMSPEAKAWLGKFRESLLK